MMRFYAILFTSRVKHALNAVRRSPDGQGRVKNPVSTGHKMRTIDITKRSEEVLLLQKNFASKIVGQSEATESITNILEKYLGGLADPNRPIGSILFLGPTGTGKTSVAEALCEGLYGKPDHMVKIDCAEFQFGHEIAKLIGSPPGYLGHRETPARLKTATLDALRTEKVPFAIILFDEIEKASDELWHLLLGILDKGQITLGDNSTTDFRKTVIIMTSNIGARAMAAKAGDGVLGFSAPTAADVDDKEIADSAMSAAKSKFTPEFLNRLDEIVVFKTLTKDQIEEIMGLELLKVQTSYMVKANSQLHVSPAAMREVLARGYDKKYNARGIRRAIEREISTPIARALSCSEVKHGETIVVDYREGKFHFHVMAA